MCGDVLSRMKLVNVAVDEWKAVSCLCHERKWGRDAWEAIRARLLLWRCRSALTCNLMGGHVLLLFRSWVCSWLTCNVAGILPWPVAFVFGSALEFVLWLTCNVGRLDVHAYHADLRLRKKTKSTRMPLHTHSCWLRVCTSFISSWRFSRRFVARSVRWLCASFTSWIGFVKKKKAKKKKREEKGEKRREGG